MLSVHDLPFVLGQNGETSKSELLILIVHVNEYPTMHYFVLPRHTQSMIAYMILTKYFWKFQ